MSKIPRMRTVAQIRQIFADSGEPCISEREIRRLAKCGAFPAIYAGRRLLINLDGLFDYLRTHCEGAPSPRFEEIGEDAAHDDRHV